MENLELTRIRFLLIAINGSLFMLMGIALAVAGNSRDGADQAIGLFLIAYGLIVKAHGALSWFIRVSRGE